MSMICGTYTSIGGGLLYIGVVENDQSPGVTRMVFYDGSKIVGEHTVNTRIVSVDAAGNKDEVAGIDRVGSVVITKGNQVEFEFIEGPGTGQGKSGYLSRVKYVDGDLFACGDLCQVYRKVDPVWYPMDGAIRVSDKMAVGRGLNDIDGFSGSELYAVGDRGRILSCIDGNWTCVDSITNVSLETVQCVRDGYVYAGGDYGTLIRGRGDSWEIVATLEDRKDRFWDIAEFHGAPYCVTATALYALVDDSFEEVEVGIPRIGSYLQLIPSRDNLWLLGANQLVCFDGSHWSLHSLE